MGCVSHTARLLEKMAKDRFGGVVDDVWACAAQRRLQQQLGDDQKTTMKLLAGIISNPNAGGVLVLSLGCENNNPEVFQPYLGDYDKNRVKFLVAQQPDDEYAAGMTLLGELAE